MVLAAERKNYRFRSIELAAEVTLLSVVLATERKNYCFRSLS